MALGLFASPSAAQSSARTFGWEVVGGALGSAAGTGLGLLAISGDSCSDDVECILRNVGVVLLTASVGSGVGAVWAGSLSGGEPSKWGAALGSAVGAAGGILALYAVSEVAAGPAIDVAVFSISQGTLTALGAHLLGGS